MGGGCRLALAALLAAMSGCSAFVAAVLPDDDLSVLLPGMPRSEIERELGSPERTGPCAHGLEAFYVVRHGRARTWGDNLDVVAQVGIDAVHDAGAWSPAHLATYPGAFRALLSPFEMIGKDAVLAVRELASLPDRRGRVRVVYDASERLVAYELSRARR
jgi:hypothetical protein